MESSITLKDRLGRSQMLDSSGAHDVRFEIGFGLLEEKAHGINDTFENPDQKK